MPIGLSRIAHSNHWAEDVSRATSPGLFDAGSQFSIQAHSFSVVLSTTFPLHVAIMLTCCWVLFFRGRPVKAELRKENFRSPERQVERSVAPLAREKARTLPLQNFHRSRWVCQRVGIGDKAWRSLRGYSLRLTDEVSLHERT